MPHPLLAPSTALESGFVSGFFLKRHSHWSLEALQLIVSSDQNQIWELSEHVLLAYPLGLHQHAIANHENCFCHWSTRARQIPWNTMSFCMWKLRSTEERCCKTVAKLTSHMSGQMAFRWLEFRQGILFEHGLFPSDLSLPG